MFFLLELWESILRERERETERGGSLYLLSEEEKHKY